MLSLSPIDVPEVTINNEPGQETTFHPHVEPNTLIYVRQQRGSPPSSSSNTVQLGTGPGTLFICSDSLIWRQDNTGQGWRLTYPQISLHAISKDLDAFPHECLYLMLDDLSENGHGNGIADSKDDDDSSTEDEDGELNELRIVPQQPGANLQLMYDSLCRAQMLHPDPADVDSDEDGTPFGDGGWITANGGYDPFHPGQFDDAIE